jgi:copper(I)-binding protein
MAKIAVAFLFLAASLTPTAIAAHDHAQTVIEVVQAWAPVPAEADAPSETVYLTIKNRGIAPDRLIRALAAVAAKVDIREPAPGAKPVDAVAIDAGKDVEFSSTGFQLILTGLKRRLQPHDSFKMALEFENAGRVVVEVTVGDPASTEQHQH